MGTHVAPRGAHAAAGESPMQGMTPPTRFSARVRRWLQGSADPVGSLAAPAPAPTAASVPLPLYPTIQGARSSRRAAVTLTTSHGGSGSGGGAGTVASASAVAGPALSPTLARSIRSAGSASAAPAVAFVPLYPTIQGRRPRSVVPEAPAP